jgi:ATP-dependent helicase/DNAse subunit B
LGLYVLGLEGAEAAGEEPDSRTNGTFLHDALERLVPALASAGLLGRADVDAAALEAHVQLAVDAAAEDVQAKLPTGHPELWALHRARSTRQLMRLVREADVLLPFGRVTVEGTEVRFGEGSKSAPGLERVVLPAGAAGERDVYLRGRIDRVDATPERVGLLDYKSSGRDRSAAAKELLVSDFQLPFYLWAMRQVRPDAALAGAWVGIKKLKAVQLQDALQVRGGDVETLLERDPEKRAALAAEDTPNLPNAVHALLARLRRGDFGARATDCKYCELKAVCRISARQLPEEGR